MKVVDSVEGFREEQIRTMVDKHRTAAKKAE
jgi:hypothetical protein